MRARDEDPTATTDRSAWRKTDQNPCPAVAWSASRQPLNSNNAPALNQHAGLLGFQFITRRDPLAHNSRWDSNISEEKAVSPDSSSCIQHRTTVLCTPPRSC